MLNPCYLCCMALQASRKKILWSDAFEIYMDLLGMSTVPSYSNPSFFFLAGNETCHFKHICMAYVFNNLEMLNVVKASCLLVSTGCENL